MEPVANLPVQQGLPILTDSHVPAPTGISDGTSPWQISEIEANTL